MENICSVLLSEFSLKKIVINCLAHGRLKRRHIHVVQIAGQIFASMLANIAFHTCNFSSSLLPALNNKCIFMFCVVNV